MWQRISLKSVNMNEWCELTGEQKSLYGQLQDLHVAPIRAALQRGEYVSLHFKHTSHNNQALTGLRSPPH